MLSHLWDSRGVFIKRTISHAYSMENRHHWNSTIEKNRLRTVDRHYHGFYNTTRYASLSRPEAPHNASNIVIIRVFRLESEWPQWLRLWNDIDNNGSRVDTDGTVSTVEGNDFLNTASKKKLQVLPSFRSSEFNALSFCIPSHTFHVIEPLGAFTFGDNLCGLWCNLPKYVHNRAIAYQLSLLTTTTAFEASGILW